MKKIIPLSLAALAMATLSACNSSDEPVFVPPPPPPPPVNATLRVIHAASDAPNVNVLVGGQPVIEDLAYAQSSDNFSLAPATINVAVQGILPGNTTATVIGPLDLALAAATNYKVFAVGSVAGDTLEPLVVTSDVKDLAAGNVRLQVVHAASAAPTVDIHVTAPDAALGTALATLEYKGSTAALDVPAGNYRVRITLPGQQAVVFDSGTLALAGGTDLVVAAINSRFSGESPVSLLAVAPDGAFSDITDVNTTSSVRVVHNVSDAPAVDVIVNDSIKLVEALTFPNFTDYVGVAPDTYNVKVAAAADNSVVVIDADLTLEKGAFYSVLAVGSLGQNSIEPLVLSDMPRRIATEAQVRIVHGSTLAGPVDIYVTPTSDISTATPAFAAVTFKQETGYVSLNAGEYVVTVTPAGSKTAAIGPVALDLDANKIYTAIARDGAGLTGDVGLILMDDFVVAQ
ncbi:DUF4397 domain-containing protein [Alishewanella tabrizica]|uniref:DUF4397 domain-containing protein n=1 Tax=Alishewanella tabrizica TaxID=671278 RepID=A0ABQ2WFS3_9ALTE|nr:DUF4397 domain-containing protein [Alishewanella tabrizica]GGW50105.1 hypothetical protein GCM10008111_02430 [Alishewanella tabrizica]